MEITEVIIGKSESESRRIVEEHNYTFRVTGKDGINYMVTSDFNTNRVNVVLVNNIVVKSDIG